LNSSKIARYYRTRSCVPKENGSDGLVGAEFIVLVNGTFSDEVDGELLIHIVSIKFLA